VISYEDIKAAQAKRDAKEAAVAKARSGRKRKSSAPTAGKAKRIKKSELEAEKVEIEAEDLGITVLFYNSHDSSIFVEHILVA
jgi:hypothetical protein